MLRHSTVSVDPGSMMIEDFNENSEYDVEEANVAEDRHEAEEHEEKKTEEDVENKMAAEEEENNGEEEEHEVEEDDEEHEKTKKKGGGRKKVTEQKQKQTETHKDKEKKKKKKKHTGKKTNTGKKIQLEHTRYLAMRTMILSLVGSRQGQTTLAEIVSDYADMTAEANDDEKTVDERIRYAILVGLC
jgi:outer membrane biosynthesis protein TonB